MNVLLIEDNPEEAKYLLKEFKKFGYACQWAVTLASARDFCGDQEFTHAFVDYHLPDGTGLDFLQWTRTLSFQPLIFILSAYGSVAKAVEAIHNGAEDFFEKPLRIEAIRRTLEKYPRSSSEFVQPEDSLPAQLGLVFSRRSPFEECLKLANLVANKTCHIYLYGESGTGKEVVARLIHQKGRGKEKPFIPVNCAAIPENLIESELFGYKKGAFTGAAQNRKGKFEAAHQGTLFLDEIGDLPLSAQTKLLRVLQENRFTPLGADIEIAAEFRLLFATHKNLKEMVAQGLFREDLYYRLNVLQIHLPPLRKRRMDIRILAGHFLRAHFEEKEWKKETEKLPDLLTSYSWPGNIRELKNAVERYVILRELGKGWEDILHPLDKPVPAKTAPFSPTQKLSEDQIKSALEFCGYHREKTARYLGISRRTLQYRLAKWNFSL